MTKKENVFQCSATITGDCTITVNAKDMSEALDKIKNGDFESELNDWGIDDIEYDTLEEE